jgi:hypothetical protein
MQFTSAALLSILAMTSVAVTNVSAEDAAKSGIRGGPGQPAGEDSPVSKINRLLSKNMVLDFKRDMGLKQDFELSMQEIDSDDGSFEANGRVYSLSGLTPYSVYADGVDSILVDGEVVPLLNHTTTFLGEDGGATFLVVKGAKGEVRDIDLVNADGSVTQITEVAASIYATVPPDAYNPEDASVLLGVDYKEGPKGRRLHMHSGRTLFEAPVNATNATIATNEELSLWQQTRQQDERSLQASCSSFRNIQVAIAFDSSFCASFGGRDGATQEVERIVATASTSYYRRPGLCVNLQIVRLEGYCDSGSDPYNRGPILSGCNNEGMLDFFQDFWEQNRRNIPRDAAHLFRSRPFTDQRTIGCAYTDALCGGAAYGVNNFAGQSTVRRAVLFAHELGHNSGAGHIQSTNAGQFIMEPSVNAGTNGFAQESKNAILNHIGRVDCIGTVSGGAPSPTPAPPTPTPPGDCGSGEIAAEIKLKTDGYASETSLALTRSDGSAVIRTSDLANDQAYTAQRCLPANDCYTVTITDSVGDGICCGYGQGSFEVNVEGQRVGGGGEFGSEASVSFGQCAPGPGPTPAPPAGTCGGGNRGNGACASGQCCSQWGWCGTSADHCSGQPPSPTPAPPPPTPAPPSAGTCGGGSTGNGACANGQCCSQWGWCGTSADHCG